MSAKSSTSKFILDIQQFLNHVHFIKLGYYDSLDDLHDNSSY